uniref:Ig-like domain-containing protein n=1 Tax=Scleropages formosus TaxID=113540 RepID=A0A8C9RFN3_SCLFO
MARGISIIVILAAICLEIRAQDTVIQSTGDVMGYEGVSVTLNCSYTTSDINAYLFWYLQRPNQYPQYVLKRFALGGGENAVEFNRRFNASLDKATKTVPLTIEDVQLCDSAVYYCALRPTVTVTL